MDYEKLLDQSTRIAPRGPKIIRRATRWGVSWLVAGCSAGLSVGLAYATTDNTLDKFKAVLLDEASGDFMTSFPTKLFRRSADDPTGMATDEDQGEQAAFIRGLAVGAALVFHLLLMIFMGGCHLLAH